MMYTLIYYDDGCDHFVATFSVSIYIIHSQYFLSCNIEKAESGLVTRPYIY